MKKTIIAQLKVNESKIDLFLKYAEVMVELSNREDGCITYKLMQGVNLSNDYLFYEEYKDEKAVAFHNTSEHFTHFITQVSPILIEEPMIEIY